MNLLHLLLRKATALPIAAILLTAGSAFAQSNTQIIVTSGDAAPDGNGTFFFLDLPLLNDAGQVAFNGTITYTINEQFFLEAGIFRGDAVTPLLQLARVNTAVPAGWAGSAFTSFGDIAINSAGQVVVESSDSSGSGIFRTDGVTATTISYTGQNVPGGGTFTGFSQYNINELGQVVFQASTNPTADRVLAVGDGVSTTVFAREGQASPSGGGTFVYLEGATINDAGQVAFRAALEMSLTERGLYRAEDSTVTLLARYGDAVPVTDGAQAGSNGTFNDFRGFKMNSSGLVVFGATLIGASDGSGIFSHDGSPEGLTQVVLGGDDAPDGNGTLGGFSAPALNNAGQIAFRSYFMANTSGGTTDDEGIFRSDGETVLQVAREGQAAPDSNGAFSSFEDPALNSSGQIAFLATLTGTAGGSADDSGLYLFDDTLGLIRVAREGDALLGSTITQLAFNDGNELDDNKPGGLNDSAQVAYRFILADGRAGIALWSLSGTTTPPDTGNPTAQPSANPNTALIASLTNKVKKLKKKFKNAKSKRQVAKAKKFKAQIKKLKKKLKAL